MDKLETFPENGIRDSGNQIERLRKIREESDINLYKTYEQALREKYTSLPPEKRIPFLIGLEFLIAENNQELALLRVKKYTRRAVGGKRNIELYLSNIKDKDERNKIRYILEERIDKKEVERILTKDSRKQNEIAIHIGMSDGTLRSILHNIRHTRKLARSIKSIEFCQYLLEQGYQPRGYKEELPNGTE